ncbi:hypothetical protein EJ08DRAFT_676222 [Tothia fuscella]|uniref:Phospholipase A2 n=1 Tax=Tothia fuscella TaxID=1048955 RepID=A0A9P4U285_9PEZI|nr:hypothetical protein EJ08DRAFT_676222 [Tothia fuscella]
MSTMKAILFYSTFAGVVVAYPEPVYLKSMMDSHNAAESCSLDTVLSRMREPLTTFINERKSAKRPDCFDWCSDGCSAGSPDWWPEIGPSGPKPGDVHIGLACARHDFAYRNLKLFGNFTATMKKEADENLKKDMESLCAGSEHPHCIELAPWYEWAVEKYPGGGEKYKVDLFIPIRMKLRKYERRCYEVCSDDVP